MQSVHLVVRLRHALAAAGVRGSKPQRTNLAMLCYALAVSRDCHLNNLALGLPIPGQRDHLVQRLRRLLKEAPSDRRSKHLCLDAGYRGEPALQIIEAHGYIAHVASRTQEKKAKQRHPGKKARRWIVEVCHSWFNRFRKLLVRYEKLERSFLALNHLAAAIIALRKMHLKINIIYG